MDSNVERELVVSHSDDDVEKQVEGISSDIVWAPDSRHLYYTTTAWTSSTAIHVVDIQTGEDRFFTSGKVLRFVKNGRYKGCVICLKTWIDGVEGRGDYVCVVSTKGKLINGFTKDVVGNDNLLKKLIRRVEIVR